MKKEKTTMTALQLNDIVKYYEGKPLLNGISFSVNSEEIVCLLGPSGSGKSTLLRIIAGLEPFEHGMVTWHGRDLQKIPTELRSFGLMFQDYALFPHLNVFDNVAFGLHMQHLPENEIKRKVKRSIELVGMEAFINRKVQKLSGGEQQRIALARTLAPEPGLIMLDEPLGALDRKLREQLVQEIRRILKTSGVPAIYVTHDQEEAFTLADRILILSNGRISQSGSPEELFRFPASSWVANFLGLGTIIPAFVHSIEPFTVRTVLGDIHCKAPGQGFKAGTKVDLLIRPTSVEISHGKQNVITGIVEDCVFQGDYFKTIVHVNGYVFTFNLHQNHGPGDRLLFTFKDELVNCFEANHA